MICIVNLEKFNVRPIISQYIAAGFAFLFSSQGASYSSRCGHLNCLLFAVIPYSSSHRKNCNATIAKAIIAAVAKPAPPPIPAFSKTPKSAEAAAPLESTTIHAENMSGDAIDAQFKSLILTRYGGVAAFFAAVKGSNKGDISRKDFKSSIRLLGLDLTDAARKTLRKRIAGKNREVTLVLLSRFIDGRQQTKVVSAASRGLAALPLAVPEIPHTFKSRPYAQEQLVEALLDSSSGNTAVTAPKSRVSSQGMGGVGKTMLAAAVVRDERILGYFQAVGWLSLSQQPEILILQQTLYIQLNNNERMPEKAADSVDASCAVLTQACLGRTLLVSSFFAHPSPNYFHSCAPLQVVLDDMYVVLNLYQNNK
jgi:hypothetical protein